MLAKLQNEKLANKSRNAVKVLRTPQICSCSGSSNAVGLGMLLRICGGKCNIAKCSGGHNAKARIFQF